MPKPIRREQSNQNAGRTGYVAYYRASTDKQGESGLGLEAQRAAVKEIARNAPVLAEFTEGETAKKSSACNRPQLLAAGGSSSPAHLNKKDGIERGDADSYPMAEGLRVDPV